MKKEKSPASLRGANLRLPALRGDFCLITEMVCCSMIWAKIVQPVSALTHQKVINEHYFFLIVFNLVVIIPSLPGCFSLTASLADFWVLHHT